MKSSDSKSSTEFYLKNFKYDFSAGVVVFLVALPLCLGIALASGADLFTGLISGIVGGIVIGLVSGSQLAVSGPAAGLAVIVMDAIHSLGDYRLFLTAIVIAGILQIMLGFARAGFIANFFPSSVIKGMLAAIGIILILKQIPHILGNDLDYFGNISFLQWDRKNTFTEILNALRRIKLSAVIIGVSSMAILLLWPRTPLAKIKALPAPLIIVVLGILMNKFLKSYGISQLNEEHLVHIPVSSGFSQFLSNFKMPDWSGLLNYHVIIIGVTLAIVASLETLLSIEAVDKLDPLKRTSPPNLELKAQGIGNIVAGLIGGLPITAVIVRGSANVAAGAKTKVASVIHGILLLVCVILIPRLLNLIPLASLAAILLLVGYKLTDIKLMKEMIRKGLEHSVPFFVTIAAIVFTDLLKGIAVGLVVAVIFILKRNYKNPFKVVKGENVNSLRLIFSSEVSFLNKSVIQETINAIPAGTHVTFDASSALYIDDDVLEILNDFKTNADFKGVKYTFTGFKESYKTIPPELIETELKKAV
jgi:MFS superfamily sulfate permease-like transporter